MHPSNATPSLLLAALLLAPAPGWAQAPLSCEQARAVLCHPDRNGGELCSPGFYEVVPMGRVVKGERVRKDMSLVFPDGTRSYPTETLVDLTGLSEAEKDYVSEEHWRDSKRGGARTEYRTTNTTTGVTEVEVGVHPVAVRRLRAWAAGGCRPEGQFVLYQSRGHRSRGGAATIRPRDAAFRNRMFGGATSVWQGGGAMDQRSRAIASGRGPAMGKPKPSP